MSKDDDFGGKIQNDVTDRLETGRCFRETLFENHVGLYHYKNFSVD
jgi:hypothetical protein